MKDEIAAWQKCMEEFVDEFVRNPAPSTSRRLDDLLLAYIRGRLLRLQERKVVLESK